MLANLLHCTHTLAFSSQPYQQCLPPSRENGGSYAGRFLTKKQVASDAQFEELPPSSQETEMQDENESFAAKDDQHDDFVAGKDEFVVIRKVHLSWLRLCMSARELCNRANGRVNKWEVISAAIGATALA